MSLPTKAPSREEQEAEAKSMMSRGGYKRGGRLKQEDDAATDRRMVKKAVGQHETHDHPGKPKTKLKLKSGGHVKGETPEPRMDKRARGGAMPAKSHGKGAGHKPPVEVNIISPAAAEGEKKQAAAAGLQAGAKIGAAQAMRGAGGPPKPPMAPGAGAGGPPPGAMPPPGAGGPPGQPPMKRGGRTEEKKRGGGIC